MSRPDDPRRLDPRPGGRHARAQRALATLLRAGVAQARAGLPAASADVADPEALREARAALRRLRLLLRRFGDGMPGVDPSWGPGLRDAARRLGAVRDLDLMSRALPRWTERGAPWSPAFDALVTRADAARASLPALLQDDALTVTLTAIDAWARAVSGGSARLPRRVAGAVLDGLRRQVGRGAARFEGADASAIHRTRRRLRDLRDLSRIAAPRFDRHAVRRYLRRLEAAHLALGDWHDALVLCSEMAPLAAHDAGAAWVYRHAGERLPALRAQAGKRLRRLARSPSFWT